MFPAPSKVENVQLKDSKDKFPLYAGTFTIEDKVAPVIKNSKILILLKESINIYLPVGK